MAVLDWIAHFSLNHICSLSVLASAWLHQVTSSTHANMPPSPKEVTAQAPVLKAKHALRMGNGKVKPHGEQTSTHLMRVMEGDLEIELPEDE